MDGCTEQMLELEQPDELYRVGRALRGTYKPAPEEDDPADPHAVLRELHAGG
jgi:hypothetical protein